MSGREIITMRKILEVKKCSSILFILRKNYKMSLFMTLAASLIPYWGIWRLEINKLNQREDKFRRNSICNHKNIFCYHRKSLTSEYCLTFYHVTFLTFSSAAISQSSPLPLGATKFFFLATKIKWLSSFPLTAKKTQGAAFGDYQ